MNRRSFFGLIPVALMAGQAKADNHVTMTLNADLSGMRHAVGGLVDETRWYTIGEAASEATMPLREFRQRLIDRIDAIAPRHAVDERINPAWDGSVG